jgi:nicotinamide riboside kinase
MPSPCSASWDAARIGLIGGECTGKSTIAAMLAERLPGSVASEVLREFVAKRGRVPRMEEQRQVMLDQVAREEALAVEVGGTSAGGRHVVIGDPAPAMTALYSDVYYGDDSLLGDAVQHAGRYDLVLWCRPDLPWVPDPGQRDGPEYRTLVDERIDRFVRDHLTPAGICVTELTGDAGARLTTALAAFHECMAAASCAWQPPASAPAT